MARNWRKGEHFTFVAKGERVFGTVTKVMGMISFDLFQSGDEQGTATEEAPENTAAWQPISDDLFKTVNEANFAPDEKEFEANLKLDKMAVKRAK